MTTIDATTAARSAALATQLASQGLLDDPAWHSAFTSVPRELFVPYFFVPNRGRPGWRLVENNNEWRNSIYHDDALVTQINGDDAAAEAARRGESVEGLPTSSSSAPSLMSAMLHALDVAEGVRVLEIGTGSGYNAALLAHRLGADQVTSVEVDPAIAGRARAALTAAGHRPAVVVGDGTAGYPRSAPYDRLIATVALPSVPTTWRQQTRTGALILIPLAFAGRGGLMALLRRDSSGRASGRFLAQYGGFMAVRSVPVPVSPKILPSLLEIARPTGVPPAAVNDGHPAAFYLSIRSPVSYETIGFTPDNGSGLQTWGRGIDGSVFVLSTTDGTTKVAADGPLWDAIEPAYTEWLELGKPARERFGVTADDARQWVWLDDPDHLIAELSVT